MSLPRTWVSNGVAVGFAVGTVLIADQVNRKVPLPYLDEIFHVPQARKFCSSTHGSYDAKLTTPPGLYLLSVLISRLLPAVKCQDTSFLRSTNLILLLTLPYIISALIELNGQEREQRSIASLRVSQTAAPTGTVVSLPPSYGKSSPASPRQLFHPSTQQNGSGRQKPLKPHVSRATIRDLQQKAHQDEQKRPQDEDEASLHQPPDRRPRTIDSNPLKDILVKHTVQSTLRARTKVAYSTAVAHTITFLPPLYFFAFLYYTDVGSVFFVLSCMLAVKKQSLWLGSLLGAVSILFRQTNIVWVLFSFATLILHQISLCIPELYDPAGADATDTPFVFHLLKSAFSLLRLLFWTKRQHEKQQRASILSLVARNTAPLVPLLVGFVSFVRWNGGIVLGDKSNHQMDVHVPQLWYFLIFATIFGWAPLLAAFEPNQSSSVRPFSRVRTISTTIMTLCRELARNMLGSVTSIAITLCLIGAVLVSVAKFTIHHPFLLADNRHYTFYVWRRFRAHPLIPFALVPVYATLLCAWTTALGRRGQSVLWITAFALCTAATLVPSPLVEPRYFLLPYLILRIHTQPVVEKQLNDEQTSATPPQQVASRWLYLALEFATALVFNVITIYLFLYRPFTWPSTGVDTSRGESTVMRFMW